MQAKTAIQEFKERFQEKAARGVSDMKFFTSAGIEEASLEEFCAEVNEIDRAIARGDYEKTIFGDMPSTSKA